MKSAADQRKLIDEVKKRLARWTDEDCWSIDAVLPSCRARPRRHATTTRSNRATRRSASATAGRAAGAGARARRRTATGAERLGRVDAEAITSRQAFARLPVMRKTRAVRAPEGQRATPRRGIRWAASRRSAGAACWRRRARAASSSRPARSTNPRAQAHDYWRMARAIWAAGFRAGDLMHCSFSYHLTPAGAMMEGGAHAIGCTTFAGGVGNTELQLQADRRPAAARLHRHAELPEDPGREGRRDAACRSPRSARRWSAARPSRRRCATGCASAASRATRPMPPPTSA